MPEPMMILPGGSDFFFSIISAIIRPTELDKVVQLHFTDLFSDEFAFNNWGKIFLEYVVEHTTNAPQPSSTSFLSTPSKSRHMGCRLFNLTLTGK